MKNSLLLACAIVVLFLMNLFIGSADIGFFEVLSVFAQSPLPLEGSGEASVTRFIILESRLPQALTALLAGASLASAGLLLQTAFHNPLAGPSVLGISSGASLGVALVALAGVVSPWGSVGAALIGAMMITGLLLFLNSLLRNNLVLLIVGLLLGYLVSALITILNAFATAEGLRSYVVWGMGDFGAISMERMPLFAFPLVIMIIGCVLLVKPLNALQLGDSYATNLGVNIRLLRNILLLLVGGLTAVVTASCGPVAFIGLAVPHIARMLVRTDDFRQLMPYTMLCGSVTALLCNLLCVLPRDFVLPLNAVTPLIGVPVIVYVIIRERK